MESVRQTPAGQKQTGTARRAQITRKIGKRRAKLHDALVDFIFGLPNAVRKTKHEQKVEELIARFLWMISHICSCDVLEAREIADFLVREWVWEDLQERCPTAYYALTRLGGGGTD